MRQLSDEEKRLNQKSIDRFSKELDVHKLSKEVLEMELELYPKKQQIALFNKTKELETSKQNVEYLEKQISTLINQNELGVKEIQEEENE